MRLTTGTRLGAYEILAPLGAGGMGEVYRARDTRLNREVAVKVLPETVASSPDRLARFEREARTVAGLNHPNIVTLHSIESEGDLRFLTMELVEGETLDALIAPGGLPIAHVIEVGIPLADALSAAHERGVVHRDLKPANVMLTREQRVKVLDFGLAKPAQAGWDPGLTQGATEETPVSAPGMVMGTIPYMAPEQVRGQAVDARTDVFAIGVVLYELLTGRRPFDGATPADVMSAILHHEPAHLTASRPDAPGPLDRILRRCLAKDPERRIQTSKDVRNELEELRLELSSGAFPRPVTEKRRAQPEERRLELTAEHVRQLSVRNPRLIGCPVFYLDNQLESDTLIVCLHGLGSDHRRFEPAVRALPYRVVSASLLGFASADTHRPVLGFDDHAQVLRILLSRLVQDCRPARTILMGHSAGADQFLRMIAADEGAGVDVAGVVALGANVSMETCFVSRLYVRLDAGDPDAVLGALKSIGQGIGSLPLWLALQAYISSTFLKFGSDLEPLKRYAADILAPFEDDGDPLAGWYRAARAKLQGVRFVFSDQEAGPAEALLARHLEQNVLGDRFAESTFVIEPVHHLELLDPGLIARHVRSLVGELTGLGEQVPGG